MRVNADFSKDAVVLPKDRVWHPSPMKGVERLMLDRIGAESGHATSVVRYAAGARFSEHVHTGGEEFLVLEGEFNDEDGTYPVGTYARNPIGSRHAPWAGDKGTTIFVKLHQFDKDDVLQTRKAAFTADDLLAVPQQRLHTPLHRFGREHVTLEHLPPGQKLDITAPAGGVEILVLAGSVATQYGTAEAGAWLRFGQRPDAGIGAEAAGAVLFCKYGHLNP